MQGLAFIASGIVLLLLCIGLCTQPLVHSMNTRGMYTYEDNMYILETTSALFWGTQSYSDSFNCDALTSLANGVAATVILSCVATGLMLVGIGVYSLSSLLKSKIPLYVVLLAQVVFPLTSVGLMIHEVTGVFCGGVVLVQSLHLSGGFGCILAAAIVAIATGVVAVRSEKLWHALPTAALSFTLCIGSCLVPYISGTGTSTAGQIVRLDNGLFHISKYSPPVAIKVGDYSCAAFRQTCQTVAAFAILASTAAGVMIVAEVVVMFKSISTRVFSALPAGATTLFALIATVLQGYFYSGGFCEQPSLKESSDNINLAGGFVCSVLVAVGGAIITVLTLKSSAKTGYDYVKAAV